MRFNALYGRVSTREQAEFGFNLREQFRTMKNYIKIFPDDFKEDYKLYEDDGCSAKNLNRRAMNNLLSDIKIGSINKVVIHNLDRLTRQVKDLIYLIELFDSYDVELVSIKEKVETKTAMGRFFVMIIILIAQWEYETNSERTKRGMDQSAREGNYSRGGPAPLGYNRHNGIIVENEKESIYVRAMFNMYINDRKSMETIASFLNSCNDVGNTWNEGKVRTVLTNVVYIGTFKNSRLELKDHTHPLIEEEVFREAQLILASKNTERVHNYLFHGLCYSLETGKRLRNEPAHKPNKVYKYVLCVDTKTRINENIINDLIEPHITKYIDDTIWIEVESQVKRIKRVDSFIKNLKRMLETGVIDEEYYNMTMTKKIEKKDVEEKKIELILSGRPKWNTMSWDQKRSFLVAHVQKIVIDMKKKNIVNVEFY